MQQLSKKIRTTALPLYYKCSKNLLPHLLHFSFKLFTFNCCCKAKNIKPLLVFAFKIAGIGKNTLWEKNTYEWYVSFDLCAGYLVAPLIARMFMFFLKLQLFFNLRHRYMVLFQLNLTNLHMWCQWTFSFLYYLL